MRDHARPGWSPGCAARRAAGAGPLAVVSCDNLPDNGAVAARVVGEFAALLDPDLAGWIERQRLVRHHHGRPDHPGDHRGRRPDAAAELTGRADAAPVVTEPFTEWVLSGDFPAGRPAWEAAGARFVDDIAPFEERKLWLLNGGHSLLAYAGSARGHATIAEAVTDPVCREWLQQWWSGGVRPPDPARAGGRGLPGRRCWNGSPTPGSGTYWRRSPRTAPRSCPSASCRPSPQSGRPAGCRSARCGCWPPGSTTSAGPARR